MHGRPPALDCRGPIPLPLSISPRLHLLLLRPPQMTGDDERERERHERRGVTELGQWGEEGRVRCPYLKKKLRFPLLNHHRTIGLHSFRAWSCARRQHGKEKCGRRGWEEWRGEALSNGTCHVNMGWGVDNMPIWDTRRGEPGSLGQEKKKK